MESIRIRGYIERIRSGGVGARRIVLTAARCVGRSSPHQVVDSS